MTIAILYPPLREEISPRVFDWDFIRLLLCYSEEINDIHVFLPLECQAPESFPNISNVSIHSVMELGEFFHEHTVDVWHDFGTCDVSHLTHIRLLSHQIFPITVQVQPWRLASDPLAIGRELSEYDALICSTPSMCSVVCSALQQSDQRSLSGLSPEVFTIPPGVNTVTRNISDKRDARYLLDLPEQTLLILCLTDFSVYEGGDLFPLIHAFETVAQKHDEIRLIINGPDEYEYAAKIQTFLNKSSLCRHIVLRPNASLSAEVLLLRERGCCPPARYISFNISNCRRLNS